MDEQVRKCGMCVYNGTLFTIKKKGNPAFATTQIENMMLTQRKKDKYYMISLLCGILKKTQSLRYRAQIDGCQMWEW